ncbi:MAG: hypothetical protein WCI72_04280 [archaeon]
MTTQPREVNLKESVPQAAAYKMLCDFMTTAMLDESEGRRTAAAKTLRELLGHKDLWINRGDSIDNQFFLAGEYRGIPVNIYVCDKPREYLGKPSVLHQFRI